MHDRLPDHLLSVYRFAMHLCGDQHSAEDLTQEAMLRALRNIHTLNDIQSLRVWLFRIVKNLWTDGHRAKSNFSISPLPEQELISTDLEPGKSAEIDEDIARTMEAMKRLPDRQRMVLHLVACQQFSINEVAGVLEIRAEAVRSSLSLARAQMRTSFRAQELNIYKKF